MTAGDEARAKIQRLLVTGDNRLKQGVAPEKVRESYEQALVTNDVATLDSLFRRDERTIRYGIAENL